MAAANYDACLKKTLAYEGGYTNHPSDPGGPTNWGITIHDARMYWKADATAADVKAMPLSVAKEIYRTRYWGKMNCDADPVGVDLCVFDYGVNSGTGRAIPLRAKTKQDNIVAWIKAYCAARLSFLHGLRTWGVFGKGWGSRVADVEATAVKMALQKQGLPPAEVKKKLDTEGEKAATKAIKNAAGAGGTVVAPAGTQVPNVPTHVDVPSLAHDHTSLFILGGIALAVGLAFLAWHFWQNYQRAQAYTEAAKEVS